MTSEPIYALIPCAGIGARAGGSMPKQYQPVAGQPMLRHALQAFSDCALVRETLLVLAPDDALFESSVETQGLTLQVQRCGGATRHASVLNGLRHLTQQGVADDAWVLVHDAARPGLTPAMIAQLIQAVQHDPVGGILALPVPDTLKRQVVEDNDIRIASTEPREGLWQAQTPQMFRLGLLRDALSQAEADGATVTDEASAIERLGLAPRLVQGSLRNFKVTYPDDFALAEKWLAK